MFRIIFFLSFFHASIGVHAEVKFDVEMLKDPLMSDSVISNNGEFYINKGSARVSIYNRESGVRLGSICCREKNRENDHVYFINGDGNPERILYTKMKSTSELGEETVVGLYDLTANIIKSEVFSGDIGNENITVSGDGKLFSIFSDGDVNVYFSKDYRKSSSLSLSDFKGASKISLSYNGDLITFIYDGDIYIYNLLDNHYKKINRCGGESEIARIGFLDERVDSLFLVDEFENVCLIKNYANISIKSPKRNLHAVFYDRDDNLLLVVNQNGVFVFDVETGEGIGNFLVKPYYQEKYGRSRYEKPFIVSQVQYEQGENTLFARGSVSTKTLYKISIFQSLTK